MKILVLDAEIKKMIPVAGEDRHPYFEYCDGWQDFANMGISCLCVYEYNTDQYHMFLDDNIHMLQALLDGADLIVGFNAIAFDNKLLRGSGFFVDDERCFDIMVELSKAAGLDAGVHQKGYSLANTLKNNIKEAEKNGHGADAPIDYQTGKFGNLATYCLNDVRKTKALFDLILEKGGLYNPTDIHMWHEILLTNKEAACLLQHSTSWLRRSTKPPRKKGGGKTTGTTARPSP